MIITHTPGPWHVDYQLQALHPFIVKRSDDSAIVKGISNAQDAALIAAAPELLEACQWALNTLRDAVACPDGCPDELEAAMVAAIAKAEGKGGPVILMTAGEHEARIREERLRNAMQAVLSSLFARDHATPEDLPGAQAALDEALGMADDALGTE